MYTDKFGVEFSDDKKVLVKCPESYEGEYIIPEGVTSIEKYAFMGCTNLTAIEFPTSLELIGEYAFKCCEALESIDIPDSVTEIGQNAFWMCSSLSRVNLSANLRVIQSETFRETAIEEIVIPNSVKIIEYLAFGDCYLRDVCLPTDIEIDDTAFEGCDGLLSVDAIYLKLYGNPHYKLVKVFPHAYHYFIPDDVVEIGGNVLKDCENIDSVVIPDSVKRIHEEAFSGSKIKMVIIGNGVTKLPDSCFSDCESLEEVDIPDNISSLGRSCFCNCKNIKTIRMSDTMTSLGASSFRGCTNLQNIKLGDSIETISEEAFLGCSKLAEISLPKSVNTIGEKAFSGCTNLQNIKLSDSIETISEEAFLGCSKLAEISLPKSIKAIGKKAFFGCSSLESVHYSNNVSIGIDSFQGTLVKDNYLLPEFKYYGKMLPSQWKSNTPSGNTVLKVYRGISVKNAETAEQLIMDIKKNGLYLEQITEKFNVSKYEYKDCRGHNKLTKEELDKLYSNKLPLETALEGGDKNQVYFGDYVCAMNYATRSSSSAIPIIIEAEIPLDELNVDGIDSLAHIFNPYSDNNLVREVYSAKIDMYYEKYRAEIGDFEGKEYQKFREIILNMAESDNDIVYAFYNNNRVISGKCGNIFKCAFQTKLPISPERILSVSVVSKETLPYPDISLWDFR